MRDDGGLVMPGDRAELIDGSYALVTYAGMSLRDYFAGQAMLGQLSFGKCADMSADAVAGYAYAYADAMLAERNRK